LIDTKHIIDQWRRLFTLELYRQFRANPVCWYV